MAVSLVSEVVAYIAGNGDVTMGERLALMLIAERANANTREAWQSTREKRWVLGELVGVGENGLKSILQRLAKRGLEVRVAIGKDKNGKIMYAVKGHQTTYRLPTFPGVTTPPKEPYGGVTTPNGGVYTPNGGVTTPPFSLLSRHASKSMHAREPWQIVIENTDAKPEEAKAVAIRIISERNPRNPGGFIVTLARSGELSRYLTEHRAAQAKADRQEADAADRQARRGLPRCDHGEVGGELPHSVTGEIRCSKCRKIQQLNETRRPA